MARNLSRYNAKDVPLWLTSNTCQAQQKGSFIRLVSGTFTDTAHQAGGHKQQVHNETWPLVAKALRFCAGAHCQTKVVRAS
eukprot:1160701-Pelagomonas_calceolata.AAC.1